MLRLLGLGLAGALVLVSGPAERKPLTHDEYVAVVRAALHGDQSERLFEDVVNDDYYRPSNPCRECRPRPYDTRTAVGKAWLRSERSLRAEAKAFANRLDEARPPADVARLNLVWISAIRGCAESLRRLEPDLESVRPADEWPEVRLIGKAEVAENFQKEVAGEVGHHCFDQFREISAAFNEKGYEFE